jgi:hypothetical protein
MRKLLLIVVFALACSAAANAAPTPRNALSVVISGKQGGALSPYLQVKVTFHNLLKRPTWPQNVRVALRGCNGEQDRLQVAWATRGHSFDEAGQLVWSVKLPANAKRSLAAIIKLPTNGGPTFCVHLHLYTNASAQPIDREQQFPITR